MKISKLTVSVVLAAFLFIFPLLVNSWLSAKDRSYDDVVNTYECERDICERDFNGDGVPGHLERTAASDQAPKRSLLVVDDDRELLRLPYEYVDGTLRTHVAIRDTPSGARVLIFDRTQGGNAPVVAVYAYDSGRMIQVQPLSSDAEILSAMAARDDAGTWSRWGLYRFLWLPLTLAYYALLIGLVTGKLAYSGRRSSVGKLP